jgi:hypothetical protein
LHLRCNSGACADPAKSRDFRQTDRPMKLIVTGGRDYRDRAAAFRTLDKIHAKTPITLVVHGACMKKGTIELCGADRWAEEWAR